MHLEHQFAGCRMLRDMLQREGFEAGRKHVGTLMAKMGIQALYRKPTRSRSPWARGVFVPACEVRRLTVPNEVWAMDIAYIPMAKGWGYLAAVVD